MSRLAAGLLLLWGLAALAGILLPLQPDAVDLARLFAPPLSPGRLLGGDALGRSLGERLLAGAGVSLLVAVLSVTLSAALGALLGMVAGYLGGWADRLISRLLEVFLAFPGLLLAIALAGLLGPGIDNVVIALAAMGWVGYARLARNQVLALRGREHVQAAVALGRGPLAVMRLHLLPLLAAPLLVEASYGVASAVVAEAGLSFLGLGVQPPQASWGSMIREGVRYLLVAPHLVLVPGLALSLVVLAANRLGDGLRDRLDVISRSRR
ncbi:MAG TPA: ABC transporter permease [Gammaproteobacteria bacterium]|nr:ABC transporter permease [Gammaproteobacteria bacterium]